VNGAAVRELRFAATQLAIWAGLYGAYLFVRSLAIEKAGDAYTHAAQLIGLERIAGLFHEPAIQQTVASVDELRVLFNLYYMLGFGPLLGLSLVWLGLRHRHVYRELRTAMLASLGLASLFFVLYPTAPPRLIPNLGIADTVGLAGHDTGSFAGIHFDPYAAMPSMHVGWSFLLALIGVRVFTRYALRLLLALHPLLMALAVTVTGNHYFLDVLAGVAVALLGYTLVSCGTLRLLGKVSVLAGLAAAACAARGCAQRRKRRRSRAARVAGWSGQTAAT
jgi:membrane-associated phospholipid phosphatase